MTNLLVFLAVLSVLVIIHELGHFLVAKWLKIRVEEFAFGLPFTKPLFKIRRNNMDWSVYPLLLGGFVRLYGEENEPKTDKKDSFWNKPAGVRLGVISAGVVMNILLAVGGFMAVYNALGVPSKTISKVTVGQVIAGSPAEQVGIKMGDRLLAVEGQKVTRVEDYSRLVKSWAGLKTQVTVERGDTLAMMEGLYEQGSERFTVELVPRKDPPANEGATGVAIEEYPYVVTVKCPVASVQCLAKIVGTGLNNTKIWLVRVFEGLRQMGKGIAEGRPPKDVAGPIGVYQITGMVATGGFWPVVELLAVLSVNLAVFNFLPIPALDGGRALFVLLEVISRRRIPAQIEQKINSWGFAALLALMAAASFQDVIRLGWFK